MRWGERQRTAATRFEGFDGPWQEVEVGICPCGVERRLYSPLNRPDVKICAPCTQRGALAAIPNHSRDET